MSHRRGRPGVDHDLIGRAFRRAKEPLGPEASDLSAASRPGRAVIRIESAQGVIDNGGLVYFFEADWPDRAPYEEFARAYEEIGCADAARKLRAAVDAFPFSDPHLHGDLWREFMASHHDGEAGTPVDGTTPSAET